MLFPIGTRVEMIGNSSNRLLPNGSVGTVVGHYGSLFADDILNVEWDKSCNGHTCGGLAKAGHGWRVSMKMICEVFDDTDVDVSIDLTDVL